jgi:PAS domain S-box-containing protein
MGCELERISFDAIFTTDPNGIITSSSHGAESLLGLFPNKANGLSIESFFSGGAAVAAELLGLVKKEGRIRNYLTEFIATNGRRISVSISASAFKNTRGEIAATLIVAHNLTEMRKLEDELAAKNRFMANILQDSADAIITLDPEDIITSWNKGAEAIFGYTEQEVVGKSLNVIIPTDLQEAKELARIGEKIRSQGVVNSYQTERTTKDGRRIQVIFTRTAIRNDSGRLIGSSAVLKDVTTYRNLERQLADAEHLATLGELSAGLAHEIKNPLAGIKGAIEVIRDSIPVTDAHREILGDVVHQVNRIDLIVRDLLNYAKPKPPSHLDINLSETMQRILAMVRKTSKHDSLSIQVHRLTDIPGFTGDETQLEQVILNLLLNAQCAMPRGGMIQIRFSHDPSEAAVRIEVEDNGPGIPEEVRKKLFQPFFTTRTDGTGLGLATSMKNVQYHGGSIEVHSQLGQGTKFIVTLPMLSRL